MIVAVRAGAAMKQPPVKIVSTLTRVYSGVLTTRQLQRLLSHLHRGVDVCCGPTADYFIWPDGRAASPEAMANAVKLPWNSFSGRRTPEIPESWQQTFQKFCTYSGGLIDVHSLYERDLLRGVDLWDYTRAIRRADPPQVLDAIFTAAHRRGLNF